MSNSALSAYCQKTFSASRAFATNAESSQNSRMSFGANVRARRKELSLTLQEVAERMGQDASFTGNLSRIENDKQGYSKELVKSLAGALQCKEADLFAEASHRAAMDKSQYNVGPSEKPSVKLPLVSWVSAGLPDDANDPYAPGAGGEWVNFDGPFGRQAFCLTVRGDSMVSQDGKGFPDGCVIAVDPSIKARSGDFVVVRFNNSDEATFKQYLIDGPAKLLKPLNSTYPTFQITPDAQMCGVVVEVSMRRNLRNGRG